MNFNMKKTLTLILAILMTFSLVNCRGNVNETTTNNNIYDLPVYEFSGWFIDVGYPQETVGIDEWQMYLDQDTYYLYQYNNSKWSLIGCIRGIEEAPLLEQIDGVWYINGKNTSDFCEDKLATITIVDRYFHINDVDTGILAEKEPEPAPPEETRELTEEEFNSQPAMFGSIWVNNNTRMKILVKVRMAKGTKITFLGDTSVYCWAVVETTDKDNAKDGVYKDSGWNTSWANPEEKNYMTTYLTGYLVLTVGKLNASGKVGEKLTEDELANIHSMFKVEGIKAGDTAGNVSNNGSVNNPATKETMVSINHRGWHQGPENTLSAYRESYNHGFKYVECDVQFTKDGVPVLLHDDTIDRTSNGTGYLSQMTYAQVSQYDFSYDDADTINDFSAYRGEKIPTFVEFIALCKELNLHPYIEIKGNMTDEEAKKLIQIVNEAGMIDNVSWLSFSGDALSKIAANCPTARIVWVITDTNASKIAANNIPYAKANLMTGQNQVVFDLWYTLATQDVVDVLSPENIPLEVWTVNDLNAIYNLHPYVTGVSSDYHNAKQILLDAELNN